MLLLILEKFGRSTKAFVVSVVSNSFAIGKFVLHVHSLGCNKKHLQMRLGQIKRN